MQNSLSFLTVAILSLSVTGVQSAYPSGYLSEMMSLAEGAVTAGISVDSVGAHATGVAGAAWSSIEAFQTVPAPTNDAEASSYRSALFSLNDLLPSEVRSFYSSLGNAQSSIRSKYNVPFPTAPPSTTTTSTAAAKTGGADKLANAMGVAAIGLGAVAVLL